VQPLSIDCANAVPEISAVSASAARNVAIAPFFMTALLAFSENMVSKVCFFIVSSWILLSGLGLTPCAFQQRG
jgi:hypothetical protein